MQYCCKVLLKLLENYVGELTKVEIILIKITYIINYQIHFPFFDLKLFIHFFPINR